MMGRTSWTPSRIALVGFAGVVGLALGSGCSSPDASARIDPIGPDPATFQPVAHALAARCGMLDCHGSMYRNYRIYGYGSLRLLPTDKPNTPLTTTAEEAKASYDALVGLEPELMREVVLAKGAGLERLTVVRKGRGEEAHKGGKLIARGDDTDVCLTAWLRGQVPDPAACTRAATVVDAGSPPAPTDAGATDAGGDAGADAGP